MPTYTRTPGFQRAYSRLSPEQSNCFKEAVKEFVSDLLDMEEGLGPWFRASLRVKKVKGSHGLYEMSWNSDGRATFSWGEELVSGKRHVVWHQIGGHEILP